MKYKAWEFENDWYISINGGLTFCMNQEAACIEFVAALARINQFENALSDISEQLKRGPVLKREDAPPEEDEG